MVIVFSLLVGFGLGILITYICMIIDIRHLEEKYYIEVRENDRLQYIIRNILKK